MATPTCGEPGGEEPQTGRAKVGIGYVQMKIVPGGGPAHQRGERHDGIGTNSDYAVGIGLDWQVADLIINFLFLFIARVVS